MNKLRPSRRFQQVVEAVEDSIMAGKLRPGDQLPPELELKELFGTGRGTIREALRVLEEKGLIVIKAGAAGGAFVTRLDPAKLTEHLELLVQTQAMAPGHIHEFREAVEPMAASLAAGRVTPAGAARLRTAFAEAEKGVVNQDAEAFFKGDAMVHMSIAELTGNPLLVAVLKMVHAYIPNGSDEYALPEDKPLSDNLKDLRGLVQAVSNGHVEDAGWRAMGHVRTFHRGSITKGEVV